MAVRAIKASKVRRAPQVLLVHKVHVADKAIKVYRVRKVQVA